MEWDLDVHATLLVLSSREIDLNYSEQTDRCNYNDIIIEPTKATFLQDAGSDSQLSTGQILEISPHNTKYAINSWNKSISSSNLYKMHNLLRFIVFWI